MFLGNGQLPPCGSVFSETLDNAFDLQLVTCAVKRIAAAAKQLTQLLYTVHAESIFIAEQRQQIITQLVALFADLISRGRVCRQHIVGSEVGISAEYDTALARINIEAYRLSSRGKA